MRFTHALCTLVAKFMAVSVCTFTVAVGPTSVAAFAPAPPPKPPVTGPTPSPRYGPGIPYISGRLGGFQQNPTDAPTGAIVPDDFCLPGKFDRCGDHLRDQPDFSPSAQDGPVFVDEDNSAFGSARYSGWANGQFRQTEQTALLEQRDMHSFSIGADRQFGHRFILGTMVVSTDTTNTFVLTGVEDHAIGFLAGPYFAYQISEDWVLDGRFLAGNARHSVLTAGVPSGNFESFETFGALRISGTIDSSQWRLHPSLEVANITQNDDGLPGTIAASSSSDTFVTASALAYYDGFGSLTPYIGLEATNSVSGGDVFGVFRAGFATTFGNGAILNVDYAYGAIGLSNVNDEQFSIRIEIPF